MKLSLKSVLFLLGITLLFSCASENNILKTVPQLTTTTITNIALNTASSGGNITSDGDESVSARGIVWNTATAPTTTLTTKTTDGNGIGNFSSSITNLIPSSTYFVRAYATNNVGTAYGNELSFTTGSIVLPTVSTTTITNITTNSAISGGNITADGGGTITSRGIVWSTTQNPTIILTTKTTDGAGTGNFLSNLTNLEQNTSYFIKAYATNSAGTTYGNQVEFKTNAVPITVTDADGYVYKTVQIGTQQWMAENLKTTKYCNGDAIPYVNNASQWNSLITGAYIYSDDSSNLNAIYGKLYNWYVAADSRNPCPCGWRVPSADDWIILGEYLGGIWKWSQNIKYYGDAAQVGGKLKSIGNIEDGTGLWYKSNYAGNNSTGFNGLPVGSKSPSMNDITNLYTFNIYSRGIEAYFWASTHTSFNSTWKREYGQYISLGNNNQNLWMSHTNNYESGSIRCLKN